MAFSPLARLDEKTGLLGCLDAFGVRLGDLRPGQVPMFLAARRLAELVRGLGVKAAGQPTHGPAPMRPTPQSAAEASERGGGGPSQTVGRMPTDDMHLGFLHDTEELPAIFPDQWLMEEVAPDWFYSKLAAHDLRLPLWEQEIMNGRGAAGLTADDLMPGHGRDDRDALRRPHAYLLLDVSGSMVDGDRRGTVARGLALAFVHEGWRQGARLLLRPFASTVGDLLSGSSAAPFHRIVRRIIALENAGETGLQGALEQAVADIRAGGRGARADIMLITDGVSRLGRNPLEGERLHCFVLGADQWCDGPVEHDAIRKLQEWSTTWHRLRTERFPSLITPTAGDLAELQQIFTPLSPANLAVPGLEAVGDLAAAIDNALYLDELYQAGRSEHDPEFSSLRRHLKALRRAVREAGAGSLPRAARAKWQEALGILALGGGCGDEERPPGLPLGPARALGPEGAPEPDPGEATVAISWAGVGRSRWGRGLTFAELVRALWRSMRRWVARLLPGGAVVASRSTMSDGALAGKEIESSGDFSKTKGLTSQAAMNTMSSNARLW
ncbi:MAG: hypothetical protein OZSIB_1064 [Candidatus Ozemobacter sibiricus]|uniref:VWFA domain-containing protein n=1 Tax=Candidatus Ozemobacter sibiricus TaxID=2268124 RepID=A0A367Z8L0_9BACT|nr:MAG: hypothetical protein OZSIB_1064 [Candidatus Ozemobacter sibiricus]